MNFIGLAISCNNKENEETKTVTNPVSLTGEWKLISSTMETNVPPGNLHVVFNKAGDGYVLFGDRISSMKNISEFSWGVIDKKLCTELFGKEKLECDEFRIIGNELIWIHEEFTNTYEKINSLN